MSIWYCMHRPPASPAIHGGNQRRSAIHYFCHPLFIARCQRWCRNLRPFARAAICCLPRSRRMSTKRYTNCSRRCQSRQSRMYRGKSHGAIDVDDTGAGTEGGAAVAKGLRRSKLLASQSGHLVSRSKVGIRIPACLRRRRASNGCSRSAPFSVGNFAFFRSSPISSSTASIIRRKCRRSRTMKNSSRRRIEHRRRSRFC